MKREGENRGCVTLILAMAAPFSDFASALDVRGKDRSEGRRGGARVE